MNWLKFVAVFLVCGWTREWRERQARLRKWRDICKVLGWEP